MLAQPQREYSQAEHEYEKNRCLSALLGGAPAALSLIDRLTTEINAETFNEGVDADAVSAACQQIMFLTSTLNYLLNYTYKVAREDKDFNPTLFL